MGNKQKVSIESFDVCDKNLYIGASDGTLYHFLLREDVRDGSKTSELKVVSLFQAQRRLSAKKPIVQVKASAALKCLLVTIDGLIQGYSMMDLSPAFAMLSRIKNVNKFYINDHPVSADPFSIEMFVTFVKRKNIQLYQVQEDNMLPLRELSFQESPLSLAVDGHFLCVGTASSYFLYDLNTNKKQELLPVEDGKAFVHRVAAGEFLLAAPNSLGVFVTSAGISQRPPIQWSTGVCKACFVHPYVIALDSLRVTVHSVLDQEAKQSWPFQGGLNLMRDNSNILLCTTKDIFILSLIPFKDQVSDLIERGCVEEGIELAKECAKVMRRDQFRNLMLMAYRKAGFEFMKLFNFEKAKETFVKGEIDEREVISLFPNTLPHDTSFVRHSPPYHHIRNILDMTNGSSTEVQRCYEFLSDYLLNHALAKIVEISNIYSETKQDTQYELDILMSCISVFAKLHQTTYLLFLMNDNKDLSSVSSSKSRFLPVLQQNADIIEAILIENGCFHASAVFCLLNGAIDQAMCKWKDLARGIKSDDDYSGLQFVAEMLGRHCKEANIIWKHAEWILGLDEKVGISVFTKYAPQPDESGAISEESVASLTKVDDIIDFLHPYKESVLAYLEHLVFICKVQKEKYHTHLAVLYLEIILKLMQINDQGEKFTASRVMLQKLLKESSLYRITLILGKVQDTELYEENVILLGKLGDHRKALDILVNKIKDQKAAELFCMEQSSDLQARRELFKNLLEVYLSRISASSTKSSKFVVAVADLLNCRAEFYNPRDVMHLLSKEWSMSLVHQFLAGTMRMKMHSRRMCQLEKTLASRCCQASKHNLAKDSQRCVLLTEDSICRVCNRSFQDPDCVLYPNLMAVHPHCGKNRNVCPVTGQLFKVEEKADHDGAR